MRRLFCFFVFLYVSLLCIAQNASTTPIVKPLYKLIEPNAPTVLVGSGSGLYSVDDSNMITPLWTHDKVLKIKKTQEGFYLLTGAGIVYSKDLKTFEERNKGLPFLTIKKYKNKEVSLEKQVAALKDISVNPCNELELVTASKDSVYITRDGGKVWKSLGSMSAETAGMKAVAIVTINGECIVFMSHPIFGVSYCKADESSIVWHDITGGFEAMPSQTYPDEVSNILPVLTKDSEGRDTVEIYMAQSYIPRIYRFDWEKKRAVKVYAKSQMADTIDALAIADNALLYTTLKSIEALDTNTYKPLELNSKQTQWQKALIHVPEPVYTAFVPKQLSGFNVDLSYGELWLLNPGQILGTYTAKACDKKAVYIPAHQVFTQKGIDRYRKIIKDNALNALVIDMKDDYGLIHYHTNDDTVKAKCKESRWALDIDDFINQFKKQDNVYMIARIVAFKDPNLASIDSGKYAVWDKRQQKPWVGTRRIVNTTTNEDGTKTQTTSYGVYDEQWIDPYSPEVWEYDVAIAQELVRLGFDEIQFDYIRFPTDGLNIGDAQFRAQSKGMDKESALISFLSYARENISAPIGIDIYGANGWYRSGTRTGQDVELLAEYVDVICPMFYPSHFENSFLNYAPYPERPYRIYYYGTYRNTIMGRGSIIVRPWVQAFYMNVPYDRQFYDKDYVRREIFGVRDSTDRGYMYWNNAGNYEENLTKDPDTNAQYPWQSLEASSSTQKPVIGPKSILPEEKNVLLPAIDIEKEEDKMRILDTIRNQRYGIGDNSIEKELNTATINDYSPLEKIRNAWKTLGGQM